MTSFTVVTVLHDSSGHVVRLLDSLERHLPPDAAHVIAVDSGSRDDGPDLAAERGCEVVALNGNPGFGAANNAGVERVRHDVTVLLNPDVELVDDGLLRLAAVARRRDALHVPRLLNEDRTIQDSTHPRPGTVAEVARALLPARVAPQPYRAARPRRVGWSIGAAIVARTATLRALGPFDARAFLYYEDLDLCLRAPVPTILHPAVALVHAGGHATRRAALAAEARRRRAVVGARLGPRALALDDVAQALTFARAGVRDARARAQLRALRNARTRAG